jgi:uridine phosphorylase
MREEQAAIHLKPTAQLAERVLLPGDPHRALAIAQAQLEGPRMFNHRRGLWGYSGAAKDGRPLTIQSSGMGGPSAAIVVEELIDLGARLVIRVGTCGALGSGLPLGELVAAGGVLSADGASTALGASERLVASPDITESLVEAGARRAVAVSTDLFYDDRAGRARRWAEGGAEVVEMEAAAVLRVAERRGVRAGCLLAVTDLLSGEGSTRRRERIDPRGLEAAELRLGEVACSALVRLAARAVAGAGDQADGG